VSSGRKSADSDLIRLDIPLFRIGADDLQRPHHIELRRGSNRRLNPVLKHKGMVSKIIETAGYRITFMDGAVMITASRKNQYRTKWSFCGIEQKGIDIRHKIIFRTFTGNSIGIKLYSHSIAPDKLL
jgi:hypothetical protein